MILLGLKQFLSREEDPGQFALAHTLLCHILIKSVGLGKAHGMF